MNYLIALAAYVMWGIFPLYWKLLPEVDSFEIICHRIVWSLLTLLVSISILRQWPDIQSVLKDRRRLGLCFLAAALISCNWFLFIWSVQNKYVVESSLGYFINPMMNVVLGVVFFRERLKPFQWCAVAIALLGVIVMASEKGGFPWLALSLAASFALYAAVKKKTTMPAIAGLGMETAILAPVSLLAILFFPFPVVSDLPRTSLTWTYLALGGPITTIPLVLFAAAAKHVPMVAMGMLQYIAPSMQFLFAVFVFHEVVSPERMIGFYFVWFALFLFSGFIVLRAIREKRAVATLVLSALLLAVSENSLGQDLSQKERQLDSLGFDSGDVFRQVEALVQEKFYRPSQVAASWIDRSESFRKKALSSVSHDEFAQVISEMLSGLGASHTAYLAKTNPKRFQLLGIFESLFEDDRRDLLEYESIGLDVDTVDGKLFVSSLYDGFPALRAGLQFGDEIVAVDGAPYHAIESFKGKSGATAQVEIRRSANGPTQSFDIPVVRLNGRTMFEHAMSASLKVDKSGAKSIGYVHVWSYAGAKYQRQLRSLLLDGELRGCDGLILDLRDGWGGASLEYLDLFRQSIAKVIAKSRDGVETEFRSNWGKPTVLLVNQRTTSGKELFTFGFKKLKIGEVVGTKTAGAVLAGSPNLLSNGDVLYLAVNDIVVDGQRLEGIGVEPDHVIARPLPYAANADPQLEKAFSLLQSH